MELVIERLIDAEPRGRCGTGRERASRPRHRPHADGIRRKLAAERGMPDCASALELKAQARMHFTNAWATNTSRRRYKPSAKYLKVKSSVNLVAHKCIWKTISFNDMSVQMASRRW